MALGFSPIRSATLVRDIERLLGQADASILNRLPEEVPEPVFLEGGAVRVTVNRYERDPDARAECLRIHGSACSVCRVDLASVRPDCERAGSRAPRHADIKCGPRI
jgi:hypothetical protein